MTLSLAILLLGLCLGSFVNALVWRLYKQEKAKSKKSKSKYSILNGRSMCPHCGHRLSALDLVPVLSWLLLRGKCWYCNKAIHWQYPLVEVIAMVLLLISYVFWPYELDAEGWFRLGVWVCMLTVLIALLVYDLKWMILPDRLTYTFNVLAVIQLLVTAWLFSGGLSEIAQSFAAILPLGGFFYILFQVSDGKWIGGGDVKLGLGLGLLAGTVPMAILILLLSSVLGSVVSIGLMMSGKASRKTLIPYGPFLIIATIFVQIFGANILNWYSGQFL